MERDGILSQGAMAFTKDRMMENSDKFTLWVCELCGIPARVTKKGDKECRVCQTKRVGKIIIPYAMKLLSQELAGLGVLTRFVTTPFKDGVAEYIRMSTD